MDSAPCNFEFKNATGIITSDSAKNYSVCSWFITAPIHHNIRLEFTTFQLTNSQVLGQNWIEIFDGKSANRLGVYVGTRRPFVVKSSGRFMLVKLIKKGTKCSPCNFKAVYTMIALTKGEFCSFQFVLLPRIVQGKVVDDPFFFSSGQKVANTCSLM